MPPEPQPALTPVQEQAKRDVAEVRPLMENLNAIILIDVRMTDYLMARGFLDRLISRIERMTQYSGAEAERQELDRLIFKGEFEIYGKKVKHNIHWVDLNNAYLNTQRMRPDAKFKIKNLQGKKVRMTVSELQKIMLDVIRKVEEISAKILIKATKVIPQQQQGSPFSSITNLGFHETGDEGVETDLDAFGIRPPRPKGLDDEDEMSEADLAKHSQPI